MLRWHIVHLFICHVAVQSAAVAHSVKVYKVLLLVHSTLTGHTTPTGARPVSWNQLLNVAGTEMGVYL